MPRRGKYQKHPVSPDYRYNNVQVQQFINKVMLSGKKATAENIVYSALDLAAQRLGRTQLEVFETALRNASPSIKVVPKRVGGATYQVPVEVDSRRANTLALRWMVGFARARREKTMGRRLAGEILDAKDNIGSSVKRKEDTHRMAEANRAFAHYRW